MPPTRLIQFREDGCREEKDRKERERERERESERERKKEIGINNHRCKIRGNCDGGSCIVCVRFFEHNETTTDVVGDNGKILHHMSQLFRTKIVK